MYASRTESPRSALYVLVRCAEAARHVLAISHVAVIRWGWARKRPGEREVAPMEWRTGRRLADPTPKSPMPA